MKDFEVTMMLCDAAQVSEGKFYILGGGWSITGPGPTPFGIAVQIAVPWDLANRKQKWMLRLEDQDGKPVEGVQLEIGGEFEVARSLGLPPGVPLECPLAINFGPLALPPGGRYVWRLFINGGSTADWTLSFSTRAGEVKGSAA